MDKPPPSRQQLLAMDNYRPSFPHSYPGSYFLTFEGIDGCGKSTQIQQVAQFFHGQGKTIHCLREPGGTIFGEQLRSVILATKQHLHPLAEAHLFAAARAQLLQEKILPLLAIPNQIILLDRYLDSSLVYQGIGRHLEFATIWELHQHPPLNIIPHLTFYLAISAQSSLTRCRQRSLESDYFEQHNIEFFESLITGYQDLALLTNGRIKTINGEGTVEEVFREILPYLQFLLDNDLP